MIGSQNQECFVRDCKVVANLWSVATFTEYQKQSSFTVYGKSHPLNKAVTAFVHSSLEKGDYVDNDLNHKGKKANVIKLNLKT